MKKKFKLQHLTTRMGARLWKMIGNFWSIHSLIHKYYSMIQRYLLSTDNLLGIILRACYTTKNKIKLPALLEFIF